MFRSFLTFIITTLKIALLIQLVALYPIIFTPPYVIHATLIISLLVTLGKMINPFRSRMDGTITIDTSDPATDRYSLELNCPLEDLALKDVVKLNISQK